MKLAPRSFYGYESSQLDRSMQSSCHYKNAYSPSHVLKHVRPNILRGSMTSDNYIGYLPLVVLRSSPMPKCSDDDENLIRLLRVLDGIRR